MRRAAWARSSALLLALLLCSRPASAAWSVVSSGSAGGLNSATVSALSTSTATLFVAFGAYYGTALTSADIADTCNGGSSNTWVALTARSNGVDANIRGQFFYVIAPTTSGSCDFTLSKNNQFIGLVVFTMTGFTPTFSSQDAGTSFNAATTVTTASIGSSGDLVFSGINHDGSTSGTTIDSGFNTIVERNYSGGVNEGAHASWKEVSGAVTPKWDWTTGAYGNGQNINFTSGGGGGGGATPCGASKLLLGVGCDQ